MRVCVCVCVYVCVYVVMLSQVEVNHRKQEPIPVGWGINKDGKVGEHGCNKT